MNSNAKNFNKQIDIIFKNALVKTITTLNYELESAYESCIYNFYMNYTPKYYNRTLMTYEASSLVNKDIEAMSRLNSAEINISDSNIPGNPYRADKDWVFERTFLKGIHGHTLYEKKTWGQKSDYWHKKARKMLINSQGKDAKSLDEWVKLLGGNAIFSYRFNQYKRFRKPINRTNLSSGEKYLFSNFYSVGKSNSDTTGFALSLAGGKILNNKSSKNNKAKTFNDKLDNKFFTMQETRDKYRTGYRNTPKYNFDKAFNKLKTRNHVENIINAFLVDEILKGR